MIRSALMSAILTTTVLITIGNDIEHRSTLTDATRPATLLANSTNKIDGSSDSGSSNDSEGSSSRTQVIQPRPVIGSTQTATTADDLANPAKKEIAMEIVCSAENSSLNWKAQYTYIEDIGDASSFGGIRAAAISKARPPSQGGDETTYLEHFLDARAPAMKSESAHSDTSRVDTEQRVFLQAGNLALNTPLSWSVYRDPYSIK